MVILRNGILFLADGDDFSNIRFFLFSHCSHVVLIFLL